MRASDGERKRGGEVKRVDLAERVSVCVREVVKKEHRIFPTGKISGMPPPSSSLLFCAVTQAVQGR